MVAFGGKKLPLHCRHRKNHVVFELQGASGLKRIPNGHAQAARFLSCLPCDTFFPPQHRQTSTPHTVLFFDRRASRRERPTSGLFFRRPIFTPGPFPFREVAELWPFFFSSLLRGGSFRWSRAERFSTRTIPSESARFFYPFPPPPRLVFPGKG